MKDKSALLWGSIGASVALLLWTLTECLVFDAPDTTTQGEDEGGTEMCFDQKIGDTPLVYIKSLSELTGCDIFAKMECRNPGGSGKDRPALYMLQDMACKFKSMGLDAKNSKVIESTSGNTGISLAAMCRDLSLELHIVMPDDQSIEKTRKLEALGANVKVVANCAIANAKHYVNEAKRMAKGPHALPQAVHLNQFENLANTQAHLESTGPELWRQFGGRHGHADNSAYDNSNNSNAGEKKGALLHAFVMSAGTGGTIAGVSRYFHAVGMDTVHEQELHSTGTTTSGGKGHNNTNCAKTEIVLADPQGSSLYHKVAHGVCYAPQQREQKQRKHRYDSIVEGVGLDRVTANFDSAIIDSAESVTDQEMVDMAHWVLHQDGLFVSSSSALNLVATVRVARRLGPGKRIATIVCETGQRHLPRFWNPEYLAARGLQWPSIASLAV